MKNITCILSSYLLNETKNVLIKIEQENGMCDNYNKQLYWSKPNEVIQKTG